MEKVIIVGGGLAGCEAAYQLIKRGIPVIIYEGRPFLDTGVHKTDKLAELVCSNSFRARDVYNAVGLLKEEMIKLDSLIMKAALACEVEAGGALAVDRELFSSYIGDYLSSHELVEIRREEVKTIPTSPSVIATGPLTSPALEKELTKFVGDDAMYFYDAVAPIVDASTIDMNKCFMQSRYDKGDASYINAPMTEAEFDRFYEYLINAPTAEVHDVDLKVFEGCMPVEEMGRRGKKTLLFGPLKPVGITDPRTGKRPFAVVQLRQDNRSCSLYNIVGFQTHLKWGAQKELIHLIPGLEKAEIMRYGIIHRNTYINSRKILNANYQVITRGDLFFAGQMTGVEGYLESASSGLVAGLNMARYLKGEELVTFGADTAIGSLANYISFAYEAPLMRFDPMNVNFGIFSSFNENMRRQDKKRYLVDTARASLDETIKKYNL